MLPLPSTAGENAKAAPLPLAALTRQIPRKNSASLTGSQFAAHIAQMDPRRRERAIRNELFRGNLPHFLRRLVPIELKSQQPGDTHIAVVFVMPDYLAIGSDQDFLRIPMNLYTASAIASRMGFALPTTKIVDAIYRHSAFHFSPWPMTPGPDMRSTEYYRLHNEEIEQQSRTLRVVPGMLVSGDKKDVVVTNSLFRNPGRIAIYGWHRLNGIPIQPLSTVHGTCYADYSHGIRLISQTVLIDGRPRSIYDVLRDRRLAGILSDEGPIPKLRQFMVRMANEMPCGQRLPALSGDHLMSFTQRNPR